ncbi:trypsin-like peptidase domain-containing protein [Candidatus Sumerlaeota bacterium]|nr:trypsin-like peptidase domain-containing protein [Candidatus Sumerlaeota bacterium]
MRRATLSVALLLAVAALTVVNWRLAQDRHVASHDPQALSSDTFARIAHRVLPQTVTIYVTGSDPRVRALSMDMLDQLLEEHGPLIGPLLDPDRLGLVEAAGSGVVVRPDGYVVTNRHVVGDIPSPEYEVRLYDGRVYRGEEVELIASDALTDLAVLRLHAHGLDAVEFGDSDQLNIGDWVVAVGNPLDLANTVTHGIVSAKFRETGGGTIVDFLQTSAHIEPGSSGGALVNIEGQLVGINTAIATETRRWQGFGFALPSNTVREVVDALIEHGRVPRGYIGVEFRSGEETLPDPMRRLLGHRGPGGVLVRGITPSGPADLAGIRMSDIILTVAGQSIASGMDLLRTVASLPIGSVAEVELWRGDPATSAGRVVRADMVIAERPTDDELLASRRGPAPPAPPPEIITLADAGLVLEARTQGPAMQIEVMEVTPGSPAEAAGFEPGELVRRINGWPVGSAMHVYLAMRLREPSVTDHAFLVQSKDGSQRHLVIGVDAMGLSPAPEIIPAEASAEVPADI